MAAKRDRQKKSSEPLVVRNARDLMELAAALGIEKEYRRTPESWRREIAASCFRPPGVALDASMDEDPNGSGIIDEILKQLRSQRLEVPGMAGGRGAESVERASEVGSGAGSMSLRLGLGAFYALAQAVKKAVAAEQERESQRSMEAMVESAALHPVAEPGRLCGGFARRRASFAGAGAGTGAGPGPGASSAVAARVQAKAAKRSDGRPAAEGSARATASANVSSVAAMWSRIEPIFDELPTAAVERLQQMLMITLNRFARLEEYHYSFKVTVESGADRTVRYLITVSREAAERVRLKSGGIDRVAWRCAGVLWDGRVQQLSYNPKALGLDAPDELFPVYLQSHALEQLYDRIGANPWQSLPRVFLFFSLVNPQVEPVRGRDALLFECSSPCGRLGYFVLRFHGDHWLVHTFLLLTMDGTPEGRKLQKRLNLCRQGIENARLDRLETITTSDVRKDPVLSKALRDCGCGHLIDAAEQHTAFSTVIPRANHVRRVLGWMPWDGSPAGSKSLATTSAATMPAVEAAVDMETAVELMEPARAEVIAARIDEASPAAAA